MSAKRITVLLLAAAVVALVVAMPAFAEDGPTKKYKGIAKMLDLDEETAAKLMPLLKEFGPKQRELRKKRRETMKRMNEELDKDASDPAALCSLIDRFKKVDRDIADLRIQRLDALSTVLTDEQVVKMITLVPKQRRRQMRARESGARGSEQ